MQSRVIYVRVNRTVCFVKIVSEQQKENGDRTGICGTTLDRSIGKTVIVYQSKDRSAKKKTEDKTTDRGIKSV